MKIKLNFGWLVTGIMICVLSAASIYAGTETVRFNGWQTVGPNGGDIRAMAIDPRDKNRLYITTLDGQIYTSADAGKVWHLLTTFNRPQITLDDILVDVEDSNYIYVSGHRHLGPGGFLYSQDAGRTWKEAKDLRNEAIHALTQSRKNPNILLAGGNGKVFISYNKGEDWTRMNDDTVAFSKQLVDSAAFDPRDSKIIYIGTTWRPYKSTDGGKTWNLISKGMIDDSDVFAIDIDPANPDHIVSSACSGIYESFNGGELWAKIQGIPSQSRRTRAIVRNPGKNGGVYAGTTEGFWMSADNGKSWGLKTQRELEVNSIAIHPEEPNKIYIATNNYGIMVSTDGGQNFLIQNGNFTSRFMRKIVVDIERPNRFYATTKNTATGGGFIFISDDGGLTWTHSTKNLSITRVAPLAILQDIKTPDTIYVGTNQGLIRSLDRGKSWAPVTEPKPKAPKKKKPVKKSVTAKKTVKPAPEPVPTEPVEPPKFVTVLKESVNELKYTTDGKNGILAATDKGLYRTYDLAKGWDRIPFGSGFDDNVFTVTQSPGQPTLWVGTSKSGLIVSKDDGLTWQRVADIPNDMSVGSIAVDPNNPNQIYVGTGQTFYISRDGGDTFTRRGGGLPVGNYSTILINPNNTNEIFAASSMDVRGGLYYSADAGQTWKQLDTKDVNLPSRRVWTMVFDPQNPNRLLVGTHSSGIYRIEKDGADAKVENGVRPRVATNGN
jgi:photosystem II stability/assembly factor-like uncharacterized protein